MFGGPYQAVSIRFRLNYLDDRLPGRIAPVPCARRTLYSGKKKAAKSPDWKIISEGC